MLADKNTITVDSLTSKQSIQFIINFNDFNNQSVPDSVELNLQIEAEKM
jgi:hypothetical protein